MQTQDTTRTGRDRLQTRLDELKTLRGEIRGKIDLAEADVREAFLKVEPAVDKAEHEVTHLAKDAAHGVANAAVVTLESLAASLRKIRAGMPK